MLISLCHHFPTKSQLMVNLQQLHWSNFKLEAILQKGTGALLTCHPPNLLSHSNTAVVVQNYMHSLLNDIQPVILKLGCRNAKPESPVLCLLKGQGGGRQGHDHQGYVTMEKQGASLDSPPFALAFQGHRKHSASFRRMPHVVERVKVAIATHFRFVIGNQEKQNQGQFI